jgi:hypothetical protein
MSARCMHAAPGELGSSQASSPAYSCQRPPDSQSPVTARAPHRHADQKNTRASGGMSSCHHQLVERFRNSQRVWAHLRVHVQHGADELPQTPVATIRLLAVPARWPSQAGPVMRCAAPPDRRKMHDNMHDNMHDKMRCTALAPLAVVTSAAALHGPCMPCVGEKRA